MNEEKPPLFDDFDKDLMFSDKPDPATMNIMDVGNRIYAISKLRKAMGQVRTAKEQAKEFYEKKLTELQEREDFLTGMIQAYLEHENQKSVYTHLGSARLVERDVVEWADEATLLTWAKTNNIDVLVSDERVSKVKLRQYMAEHPEALPPGVVIHTATKISLSLPSVGESDA